MPNLVSDIRAEVLAQHPTAQVHERTESGITRVIPGGHPSGADLCALETGIGAIHYHDGAANQEIDTDWQVSTLSGVTDSVTAPAGVSFTGPTTKAGGIAVPTLSQNDFQAIWVKVAVAAATAVVNSVTTN